jgi:hypothetical protein
VAFARLGFDVRFVGAYQGLASWLLARAGADAQAPDPDAPCGVPVEQHDAVVLDSYLLAPAAICELALALPLVTLAEAHRCRTRGILLDYHLDRSEPTSRRLLPGPSYAPLDPAFAGAGRAGAEILRVLITLGGSSPARALLTALVPMVESVFADAEILLAGGSAPYAHGASTSHVVSLPSPSALVDHVPGIDLAVTAAGLTAYEMACAGVPQVAIAIAANQRRVARGLSERGVADCLDLLGGDSLEQLPSVLERLRDPGTRARRAAHGMQTFDGHGAQRAAIALAERFAARRPPPRSVVS